MSLEHLQRVLAVNMAVLAVLGTVLLGMGQQNALLPLLIFTVAVTAVYFTDFKQIFQLNQVLANVAALVAVVVAGYEFAGADRHSKLLAIANLLVYLQIVVFYQKKTPRIYWQLTMLSLLQVVVAAALNYSVLFGLLLAVYMFVGLHGLVLFFIYREAARFAMDRKNGSSITMTAGENGRRWSLAGRPMAFAGDVNETLRRMPVEKNISRVVVRMGLMTLGLTSLLFFIFPRLGRNPWEAAAAAPTRVVGFSQTVQLGALGEVIESPEVVLRLQLIHPNTDEPFYLEDGPWLRGSLVTTYENHAWHQETRGRRNALENLEKPPDDAKPLAVQDIRLEPLSEPVVFCIHPVYQSSPQKMIEYDVHRRQVIRSEDSMRSRVKIELLTTGIRDGRQDRMTPALRKPISYYRSQLLQMPKNSDGGDPLAGLRALAGRVVSETNLAPDDDFKIALALEAFLREGGGFEYSLQPEERDPRLDPVEDFVRDNRRGHCEYFASALTLMLRSQGIPARMVIGYKDGEWNNLGQFYQFRQLHAHTWVEAYLAPDKITDPRLHPEELPDGGWLRLDPTTYSAAENRSTASSFIAAIGQGFDYVEMLWITHVVGMSQQQQRRTIYEPVALAWSALAEGVTAGRDVKSSPIVELAKKIWTWLKGNWFSWRGGAAAMIACLIVLGFFHLLRYVVRRFRGWWVRNHPSAEKPSIAVEFYRRLERLLGRHGLTRPPAQTQREFAMAAAGQLAESPHSRTAAGLPRVLVDSFYRVRFGRRSLDSSEVDAVQHALAELESALELRPDGRRNPA